MYNLQSEIVYRLKVKDSKKKAHNKLSVNMTVYNNEELKHFYNPFKKPKKRRICLLKKKF